MREGKNMYVYIYTQFYNPLAHVESTSLREVLVHLLPFKPELVFVTCGKREVKEGGRNNRYMTTFSLEPE